ncbi:MAG: hypothetical protein DMF98_20065 [Acidobacteria bacterium]|nr:MAG: hypothetical protein DMF98_20065 [Acidobacteriota bacterium]
MSRFIVVLVAIATLAAVPANAQEIAPGAGRVELSIIPGGGVFFTENTDTQEPGFGNYDLGASVGVNFNRYVGVEGEISGPLGLTQSLQFGSSSADQRTPHILNYSGNLVVSVPNKSAVVPYVRTGECRGLRYNNVLHRQRRRRREVVRRPLGAARRLPLHRRPLQGRRAGIFRPREQVRPPRLRRPAPEPRSLTLRG